MHSFYFIGSYNFCTFALYKFSKVVEIKNIKLI